MPNPIVEAVVNSLTKSPTQNVPNIPTPLAPTPSPQLTDTIPQPIVDLGKIIIQSNKAQNAQAQTPQPTQQPTPQPTNQQATPSTGTQGQKEKVDNSQLLSALAKIAPSVLATILGSTNQKFLPAASGFAQGYGKSLAEAERAKRKQGLKQEKKEQDRIDNAYDTAMKMGSIGPYGERKEVKPKALDSLAREVYKIWYGKPMPKARSTEEIAEDVQDMVTIQDSRGETRTMSSAEAKKRGYIK